MNLKLSSNKNEKGLDAIGQGGLTFEIKTRRVYDCLLYTSADDNIETLFRIVLPDVAFLDMGFRVEVSCDRDVYKRQL